MVAYSYKARFVAPIRVGLDLPTLAEHLEMGGYHPGQIIRPKRQTIRAKGKRRHARPGETLQQLFYGHAIDQVLQDRRGEPRPLHIRSEIIDQVAIIVS
jgi:hypothetical protein